MNLAGKNIRLTMLYKIINEIANVPNTEILIPADTRTRSTHGHTFRIMTNSMYAYKYVFFPRNISQRNCLPKALVDSETVAPFKTYFEGSQLSTLVAFAKLTFILQ